MSQKNGFSAQREDRISSPQTVTVYYWHRIILFGLLLVFILGGLAFWAFTQFNTAPKPAIPGSSAELSSEQGVGDVDAQASSEETLSDYEKSAMTPTPADAPVFDSRIEDIPAEPETEAALTQPVAEAPDPAEDITEQQAHEATTAPATNQAAEEGEAGMSLEAAIVDDAPVIDEAPADQTAAEITGIAADNETSNDGATAPATAEDQTAAEASVTEGADSDRGKPTRTEILSDAIARASLARGLRDREPVGIYENAVSLNGKDLITVFMFTQTRGYVGEELFHNWYLNDGRIAQVVIKPWISPMRASSSKKIIPSMIGDWRVEIVDASGKKLAVTTFEVVE